MTELQKYKIKLIFSVTFPLIIFFNILLLANEFYFLLQVTGLFVVNLIHVVFQYNKKNLINNIFKIVIFWITIIMFGFGCTFIFPDMNIIIFNSLKLGWLLGILLIMYLSIEFVSSKPTELKQIWTFSNVKNFSIEGENLIKWLGTGFLVFIVFYYLLVLFFVEKIGVTIFVLNFLLFIVSIMIIADHHLNGKMNLFKINTIHNRVFLFGSTIICSTFILLWFPRLNVICLVALILGLTLINKVISNKETFKLYFKSVTLPSILIIIFCISISPNVFIPNAYLAYGENGNNAKELIYKKKLIEHQINGMYKKMKEKGTLSKYIIPEFDIKIVGQPSIWTSQKLNLELKYSYELIDPIYADSVRYFKKGHYKLERNNVAFAIAQSFKISIKEYLKEYFQLDRKVEIYLKGSADKLPIKNELIYGGEYDYIYRYGTPLIEANDKAFNFKLEKGDIIKTNLQLAALRALSMHDFINKKIDIKANVDYNHRAFADKINSGGEYRKVEIILKIFNINPLN